MVESGYNPNLPILDTSQIYSNIPRSQSGSTADDVHAGGRRRRRGDPFMEISRRGRRSRLKWRGCEPPPDGGSALPLPPSPFI